jgi:DNA-binding transcriptional LysR family regulator
MLNLEHVRTFVAIVDAGGFQKAGTVLRLAQPTVSHQLRKLEEHLKARLLHRTPTQIDLTRHGERFLPLARSLLRAAGRAESLLESVPPTIGASSNIGIYMLQRYLRTYARQASLKIGPNPSVHDWLRSGEIDLGIVEWWPDTPGFESRLWRRERLVAIFPPGHRWASGPALPLDALFEEPLLGGEAGTGTGALLKELLGAKAARIRIDRNLGSTEAVKQAVMAGLGVSLVLESSVEDERRAGSLDVRPVEGVDLAKRILIVMPEGPAETSPARDFVGLLTAAEGERS